MDEVGNNLYRDASVPATDKPGPLPPSSPADLCLSVLIFLRFDIFPNHLLPKIADMGVVYNAFFKGV